MMNRMEQMQQASLDFGDTERFPEKPVDLSALPHEEVVAILPKLTRLELATSYKRFVGKDPTFRNLSDEELRAGITDPEVELNRLAVLDREEDQAERRNYRRG